MISYQDIIVWIVVAAAAVFVLRTVRRAISSPTGGCAKCHTPKAGTPSGQGRSPSPRRLPLVTLDEVGRPSEPKDSPPCAR